ncbi:MAG: outer membrane lipoprotein carrier protein LolA [Bacteroidales bacterium]|nr:outer membrane lipoprotein carrier protein LolA [Bacteroidales bacterium]MBN2698461.1 outer membrane lipoprotein carrier protein LolA [Bacteroidales bacterium]
MNLKHTLSILSLLLISLPLFCQQDPAAEPYLRSVATQFSKEKTYEINMEYIRVDEIRDQVIEGTGRIEMKGDMYRIFMDEYIIYFDGEKQYSQNVDNEEVYVSTPDPDNRELLYTAPINILRSYQQDFKYQFMGVRNFMGKNRYEVQLYPKEPGGPYALLRMFMNMDSKDLEAMQLRHKEGLLYTMIITGSKEIPELPDSAFRFNQAEFPNTEMIEIIE